MKKLSHIESTMLPIPMSNIDTDQIMPKQFLKRVERSGYGEFLFYDWKKDGDFPLNNEDYKDSKVLVTGTNFGTGSSREHAPWALLDFGITCVISSSFADIFYNNCFKNGILPIKINDQVVVELADYSKRKEEIEISLEKQEIKYGNKITKFEVDAFKKKCLMEGLDDIDPIKM